MRSKTELYDSLLRLQTELSYYDEIALLKKINIDTINTVLDYGCGNGYFTRKLEKDFQFKKIYFCDTDEQILNCIPTRKKYIKICQDYKTVSLPEKADLVILRHISSYITDRNEFFKWLKDNTNENAIILLIDAFDENLLIEPKMPNFNKGLDCFYETVKQKGGERDLFEIVSNELSVYTFKLIDSIKIIVSSDKPNLKEKLFVYMNLVAELDNGLPLSEKIREELMQWVTSEDAYMQYGLFVSIYKRGEK